MHKFENLEVWQLAIEYADLCYALAEKLPRREEEAEYLLDPDTPFDDSKDELNNDQNLSNH